MNSTSVSLIQRLREGGDADAWPRFARLYTPLLFFWARRVGLSPDEAEDFVQDLLVHLLDKLRLFEHRGSGSFRAWLRTVAMNKCREQLRRRQPAAAGGNTQSLDHIAAAIESDPFWEREYRQHLVARALAVMQTEFEPKTWQACWQRVVDDRPAAEVAQNLGLKEAAVHVYTGRVLRRLRSELRDLLE
jgi:RNA polymerase sigma-70 factor, ECF subfamily